MGFFTTKELTNALLLYNDMKFKFLFIRFDIGKMYINFDEIIKIWILKVIIVLLIIIYIFKKIFSLLKKKKCLYLVF